MTVFDPRKYRVVGHATHTVTSGVVLDPTEAAKTELVQVTVSGADARWRSDGTNPTSSAGERIVDGKSVRIYGSEDINRFRIIAISGDVEVNFIYYRESTT